MNLLDEGRGTRRNREEEVAQGRERAAPLAGESDGAHPHGTRLLACGKDVFRGAGRANAEQNAARLPVSLGLPGEDRVVGVVVGPRGEQGGIRREAYRIERTPLQQETAYQFAGEVHGIAGGAAVSADQQRLAFTQRAGHGGDGAGNQWFAPGLSGKFQQAGGFGQVLVQTHGDLHSCTITAAGAGRGAPVYGRSIAASMISRRRRGLSPSTSS